ncbi:hypothetical protein [Marinomonas spartinae]|uniref:hypothetical protein n=1 Tax=Marinomonas spartinae TaxID=1792290 RepID=UPI0018F1CDB4|nr:hypothetical protein [Marinomonas spartinae]MBJ7554740.1 hypothetical protein [Marinomonas spartinae]
MDSISKGLTINDQIVSTLKENKIVDIVKPYSEFGMSRYKKRRNVSEEDLFGYGGNSIFIYLENEDVIGFTVDDVKRSVVAWFDIRNGIKTNTYLARVGNSFKYDHPKYSNKKKWIGMIEEKIISIKVFVRKTEEGSKNFYDSDEIAVLLENSKDNMIISYTSSSFKYSSSMPVVKLEDVPDGFFDGTEVIEL